jgi:hypothetical protein
MFKVSDCLRRHPKNSWIISFPLNRDTGSRNSFLTMRTDILTPTLRNVVDITPSPQSIGLRIAGIVARNLLKEVQCFLNAFSSALIEFREGSEKLIIGT